MSSADEDSVLAARDAKDAASVLAALHAKRDARRAAYVMEDAYFVSKGMVVDSVVKMLHMPMSVSTNPAFYGAYPKIREFLQNAFDCLGITNNGYLLHCVDLDITNAGEETTLAFNLKDNAKTTLLKIVASKDVLTMYQYVTHPLEKSVLENPAIDPTKYGRDTAGCFGVGFKDATRQFLHEGAKVKYVMCTATEKIEWTCSQSSGQNRTRDKSVFAIF